MKQERDIFNDIVKSAQGVTLTEKEKSTLFSSVDSYIKKNPIRTASEIQSFNAANDIRWYTYIFSNSSRFASFAVIVFLILGGSTSIAAEGALPGDLLYSVKVNINEGIKTVFTTGAQRVGFETDRIGFRLKEAETLAQKGKLTEEAKNQIEARFSAHVTQVEKDIVELKNKGDLRQAFDASAKLEASLKTYEASLSSLRQSDAQAQQADEQLGQIVNKVQTSIVSSSLVREAAEQTIANSDKNDDDMRVVAESKLANARALIENVKTKELALQVSLATASAPTAASVSANTKTMPASASVSEPVAMMVKTKAQTNIAPSATAANVTVQATSTIQEAGVLLAEGEEKMRLGLYKDAYNLFQRAYEIALKASVSTQ